MQKTEIVLISDLSDVEADETVTFGLDGNDYEIELTTKEAKTLRTALANYVSAGRRTTSGRSRRKPNGTASGSKAERAAIRAWAHTNGHPAPERGRIPAATVEAYAAAHS